MNYYQGANDICLCPRATKFLHEIPGNVPGEFTAWGIYGHPDYPYSYPWGEDGQYGSYSVNAWSHNPLDVGVLGTYDTPAASRPYYYRKLALTAKSPSTVPLIGAGMWDGTHVMETDDPPTERGVHGSAMSEFCLDRHDGGPNWLFMDGNARKVGIKELWRLNWHTQWDYSKVKRNWEPWMEKYPEY